MKVATASCDFCKEFLGNAANAFNRIYRHDLVNRALFRSQEFVIVPSLGQIAEGHLLLLPIEHWTALGDLPKSLLEEFSGLARAVTAVLEEEYGSTITFEHGVRPGGSGGCGIYHAHLHAVPFSKELDPVDSLRSNFSYKRIEDLNEIRELSKGKSEYLFYQDSHSQAYLFDTPNLASQYMRKVLAERLNAQDWDWRSVGKEERLLATLRRLSNRLDSISVIRESQARYGNLQ